LNSANQIDILLVAAVAENGVIGAGNGMPWRLKSDLAHFRATTMGRPVVMGRKTFQSIGSPLKGRTTIVVSRDRTFAATGVVVAPSLAAALQSARADALRRLIDTVVIAGGAEIYAQAMPFATHLDITHVDARPAGDAVFPEIDPQIWRETARTAHEAGPDDAASFEFVSYVRFGRAL